MEVNIKYTKYEKVDIDENSAKDIADRIVYQLFDIPCEAYINDNEMLCISIDTGGSHSHFEEKEIRKASEEDKAALLILKKNI